MLALGGPGPLRPGDPASPPVYQSTIFAAESSQALGESFRRGSERFYARLGNPTVGHLARQLACLDGAADAVMFSSGMAAITAILFTLCDRHTHAVVHGSVYGQTVTLFELMRDRYGVAVDFVDARQPEAVQAALRPETTLVFIETPSNPRLHILDIAAISALLDDHHARLVVDATFASPILQRTLDLGACLVIHSCTKYIAGHSDVMAGVVAGDADEIARIRALQASLGSVLDPHAAWLIHRGLRTLDVRLRRQSETALTLARLLRGHPAVRRVAYPFLDDDTGTGLARRQMAAGGGVIAFWLEGGLAAGRRFLDTLELIAITTSLGGVETVIEIPAELDYSMDGTGGTTRAPSDEPCLLRLSCGLEDVDDLVQDVTLALGSV